MQHSDSVIATPSVNNNLDKKITDQTSWTTNGNVQKSMFLVKIFFPENGKVAFQENQSRSQNFLLLLY